MLLRFRTSESVGPLVVRVCLCFNVQGLEYKQGFKLGVESTGACASQRDVFMFDRSLGGRSLRTVPKQP